MKIVQAVGAALIVYSAVALHASVLVGPVTNTMNGHLYYLLSEDTWQNSETQAIALGGHLATINNQEEQDWVFSRFGSYKGTHLSLWIGLYDPLEDTNGLPHKSNFAWASGEPVTYINWGAGEPNDGMRGASGGREFYVEMEKTGNGFNNPPGIWNDLRSPNMNYPQFDPICGIVEVDSPALVFPTQQVIESVPNTSKQVGSPQVNPLPRDDAFGYAVPDGIGLAYGIEASTDFVHWSALTNAVLYFKDPNSTNYNERFYRFQKQ